MNIKCCLLTGIRFDGSQKIHPQTDTTVIYEFAPIGKVKISLALCMEFINSRNYDHPVLAGICRNAYENGKEPPLITTAFYNETLNTLDFPRDSRSKADHLLKYLYAKNGRNLKGLNFFSLKDYPVCYSANFKEFSSILDYLKNNTLIDWKNSQEISGGKVQYSSVFLTDKGIAKVESEKNANANDALDKINKAIKQFKRIESLVNGSAYVFGGNVPSVENEIDKLQTENALLIGQLDDVINKFGKRYIGNKKNGTIDIFRKATTIRDLTNSAIIKDVISELYIIGEKMKSQNNEKQGNSNLHDKENSSGEWIKVNPIYKDRNFSRKNHYCFVLMPFTEKWSKRVYEKINSVIRGLGFQCARADDLYGHDVLEDIWKAINEATIIIADVSNKNPNVFYETGIAHTLGKKVILLTQNVEDIPFDFKRFRHIAYEDNVDGFQTLEREIPKFISIDQFSTIIQIKD